jgi:hypothetical protein
MECPHQLEPHQIQGLDYIHIYPVVQWLVKKAIETRETEGDSVRKFALGQYKVAGHDTSDISETNNGIDKINQDQNPKRIYKQKIEPSAEISDQANQVNMTLLEYGQRKFRPGSSLSSKSAAQAEDHLLVIQQDEKSTTLNVEAVNSLVRLTSLSKAVSHYSDQKEHLDLQANPGAVVKAIQIMEKQTEAIKIINNAVLEERQALEPNLLKQKEDLEALELEIEAIDQTMEESRQDLSSGDQERIPKLQNLVAKIETIKMRDLDLREIILAERDAIIKRVEQLEQEKKSLKDDTEGVQDTNADKLKLDQIRKELALKSQHVLKLERQLDAIPSKFELDQYLNRFVELDNQGAQEYSETQQFVTLYNALFDQKNFMDREAKLLNSILDCIPDAKLSSLSAKQQFINQLEEIHLSVKQSKAKTDKNLMEQQKIHEIANEEYAKLVDEQRTYSLLLRDMREEMKKNEVLSAKLELKQQKK